MVTKDVSRDLVQRQKHYIGARLQQGRVLLDSDFNENAELAREDQRLMLVDVIGPAGSPDRGFSIRRPVPTPEFESDRLLPGVLVPVTNFITSSDTSSRPVHPVAMRAGSLYTGGLRFDLEDVEQLLYQRDYLQLRAADLPDIGTGAVQYLYYLRGWEQCVGALEDQEIREVMLKGTDTSIRVRRMRRVQPFMIEDPVENCDQAWALLRDFLEENENGTFDDKSFELRSDARLQLTFTEEGEAEDTCSPCDPFGRRYLGAENQTLRVMLTSPNEFVWGLDNPRLFRVRVEGLDDEPVTEVTVHLLDRPADERDWPFQNRVVEIIPFGALLEGADVPGPPDPHYRKLPAELGVFTRALETFDPATGSFTVDISGDIVTELQKLVYQWAAQHPDEAVLNVTGPDPGRNFYMRLWHQAPTAAEIELSTEEPPVLGTTGIVPVFTEIGTSGEYGHAGDYWIAALRPETPKQVVPFELLQDGGAPPVGPRRFFAPLGLLDIGADGETVVRGEDCRPRIRPLNNRLCTTFIVGDGVHSFGDFTRINDAIRALPRSGGVVSVRPGVYREAVAITGRDNVVLEGCGPSTIIESPEPSTSEVPALLIQGNGGNRVQVRGFAIRTQSAAIAANNCTNLVLSDLDIATGDFNGVNGAFRPGRGSSTFRQVSLFQMVDPTLRDITLRPNRQMGMLLSQCPGLTLERLSATSSTEPVVADPGPMIEIIGATPSTIRDITLRLAGQPGLLLTGISRVGFAQNIELSDLDIEADAVLASGNVIAPLFAPINIDDDFADSVRLTSSRIHMANQRSDWAAISIRGRRITIENNEITAAAGGEGEPGPLAWGGIHVCGAAQQITIRNNRILGGAGHGVTLGSVLWQRDNAPNRRMGPGFGQTSLRAGGGIRVTGVVQAASIDGFIHNAVDEGELADIVIADNRIEGFANSGISALSVLGLLSRDLLEMRRLRIERNLIRGNVTNPDDQMTGDSGTLPFRTARQGNVPPIPLLPVGGIVLANGRNIEINDNVIEDNVQPESLLAVPVNGIFVLAGDAIAIEGNRISNNGRIVGPDVPLRPGVRAGVAIMLAGTTSAQGSGQALNDFLYAPSDALDNRGFALRVVNNAIRHPEGRALHAVAAGPLSVDGNFLASEGYHGSNELHDQFAVGDVVYVQNLGAPWETHNLSPIFSPGGFAPEYVVEDTPHLSPILLRGDSPPSPRWFTGLGGGILFVNNQVVYDWKIQRLPTAASNAPLSYFPTVLLGLDHTSVIGNQFATRLDWQGGAPPVNPPPFPHPNATAPLFATVLAGGVTLNVELNRMSENIASTFLSLLGNADLMNVTTLNQCTHPIMTTVTRRDTRKSLETNNLILVQPPGGPGDLVSLFKTALQDFLKLTFRPPR